MDFDAALNAWLERAQNIINENHKRNNFHFQCATLTINPNGKKYIKIVRSENHVSTSVFCFIERETGNVLKAASWAAPAPHPRGSIYEVGNEGVSAYGAHYLK